MQLLSFCGGSKVIQKLQRTVYDRRDYSRYRSKLVSYRAGNIMWMPLEAALHTLLNFKSKGGYNK